MRVLSYFAAYGLVVSSAGFGTVYAWRVGSQVSFELACLSVLMALSLEAAKPLAVRMLTTALQKREFLSAIPLALLALVAIAFSLTSELSLWATSKSDLTSQRQGIADNATDTKADRERLKAELASLGFTEPVKAIQARLEALPDTKRNRDKRATLKADKAKAERRAAVEAQLQALPIVTGSIGISDPGSVALQTYLSVFHLDVPQTSLSQLLTLVPVLSLELGSALAFLLLPLSAQTSPLESHRLDEPQEAPEPVSEPEESEAKESPQEAILEALKANGGVLDQSERQLARLIGVSRRAAKQALDALSSAGRVTIEATPRFGTVVKLIPT